MSHPRVPRSVDQMQVVAAVVGCAVAGFVLPVVLPLWLVATLLLLAVLGVHLVPVYRRGPWSGWRAFSVLRTFFTTQLRALRNAHVQGQLFLHNLGQIAVMVRSGGRLPGPGTYRQQTRFTLPLEGTWFVARGGSRPETSHSWMVLNQRYAYDFVRRNDQGRTHRSSGWVPGDYYAFGQPVVAPADGVVVRVRTGVRDFPAPRPKRDRLDWETLDVRGNFVIIQHGDEEYSFLGHLQVGSIAVRRGEAVQRGQLIGRCGNSGHAAEPHLHFHVQDRPSFYAAAGLPIRFSAVAVDGRPAEEQRLERGQTVTPGTLPPLMLPPGEDVGGEA